MHTILCTVTRFVNMILNCDINDFKCFMSNSVLRNPICVWKQLILFEYSIEIISKSN